MTSLVYRNRSEIVYRTVPEFDILGNPIVHRKSPIDHSQIIQRYNEPNNEYLKNEITCFCDTARLLHIRHVKSVPEKLL